MQKEEEYNIREMLTEMVDGKNDWTMFADGFDDAIIGIDSTTQRVIYSVRLCYEVLMERDDMDFDEAQEFFAFNVLGSYMGEKTPIWCNDVFMKLKK